MPKKPFPLVWDSSMRGAFAQCPSKFFYNYIERLAPAESSIHLTFGKAFARALEVARREYFANGTPSADAIYLGQRALFESWGDTPAEGEKLKTLKNCLRAVQSYFERYPLGDDVVRPHIINGIPTVEFSFALPIDVEVSGERILYAGRFDMLGEFLSSLWVVDEKTTSAINSNWSTAWDLRGQFLGYVWAVRQYGKEAAGAIVRGTAVYAKEIRHVDAIVQYPPFLIDRWYAQLCSDVKRAYSFWEKGEWPMAFDAPCTYYSGCPFDTLCTKEEPSKWYLGNFVENTWSPLK